MGLGYRNLAHSDAEFVRTYKDIRGVDFSASSAGDGKCRLPYAENMYRDYSFGEYILESIPGYRELFNFGSKINGIFCHKISEDEEYIIVHAGTKLYRFALKDKDSGVMPPEIATLNDTRSAGFPFGESFYILDGERIIAISRDGDAGTVSDEGNIKPHIPTRYKDGVEYEQANLLCDKFKEQISLGDLRNYTYGSDGLIYAPNSDGESYSVIGASESVSGVVYIPSRIKVGGKYRDVTRIQDLAFDSRNSIDAVITNDGLKKVGAGAFKNCKNLIFIILSDTVESIGAGAFEGCETLSEIYLGDMCDKIGDGAFKDCIGMGTIHYAGAKSEYDRAFASQSMPAANILYGSRYRGATLSLPIYCPTSEIESIVVNGQSLQYFPYLNDGIITSVDITLPNRDEFLGATVFINAKSNAPPKVSQEGSDIREGRDILLFSGGAAIKKCTRAALFDGRVFLSGNPDFPNTVFFSSDKSPLFFGSLDHVSDGSAGYSVRSILPVQDSLIVFKSADDGGGSIFYHKREELQSSIRKVNYPVRFANNAIPAHGDSAVFYDDAVFISDIGICGLEKNAIGGVNAVCRSHNVNKRLLTEDFEKLRFTSWQGYLVVCAGERFYLADSRSSFTHSSGGKEYDWFYLCGIGAPKGIRRKYFFESYPFRGYSLYEGHEEELANSYPIYSLPSDGVIPPPKVYCAKLNGKFYHVYKSDELINEGVYKCNEALGVGELLFFGCENGSFMVFNNDKRGVIPDRILADPNLNTEEYMQVWGNKIHPDFYTFAGHAPRYMIKTGMDCCDIPYLEKNTVPASLNIKLKAFTGSRIQCEFATDREMSQKNKGICIGRPAFDTLSFAKLSFESSESPTVICYDAPYRWVEKEISVFSDTYRSPIGIYSLSYRFKIKGRIKNR